MVEQAETVKPQDNWKLEKLEIEFADYGENKGKYVGRIRFSNGDYESFCFKIRPGMAEGYIDLIAVDIVKAAQNLGDRLIASLDIGSRIRRVSGEPD